MHILFFEPIKRYIWLWRIVSWVRSTLGTFENNSGLGIQKRKLEFQFSVTGGMSYNFSGFVSWFQRCQCSTRSSLPLLALHQWSEWKIIVAFFFRGIFIVIWCDQMSYCSKWWYPQYYSGTTTLLLRYKYTV